MNTLDLVQPIKSSHPPLLFNPFRYSGALCLSH